MCSAGKCGAPPSLVAVHKAVLGTLFGWHRADPRSGDEDVLLPSSHVLTGRALQMRKDIYAILSP